MTDKKGITIYEYLHPNGEFDKELAREFCGRVLEILKEGKENVINDDELRSLGELSFVIFKCIDMIFVQNDFNFNVFFSIFYTEKYAPNKFLNLMEYASDKCGILLNMDLMLYFRVRKDLSDAMVQSYCCAFEKACFDKNIIFNRDEVEKAKEEICFDGISNDENNSFPMQLIEKTQRQMLDVLYSIQDELEKKSEDAKAAAKKMIKLFSDDFEKVIVVCLKLKDEGLVDTVLVLDSENHFRIDFIEHSEHPDSMVAIDEKANVDIEYVMKSNNVISFDKLLIPEGYPLILHNFSEEDFVCETTFGTYTVPAEDYVCLPNRVC